MDLFTVIVSAIVGLASLAGLFAGTPTTVTRPKPVIVRAADPVPAEPVTVEQHEILAR